MAIAGSSSLMTVARFVHIPKDRRHWMFSRGLLSCSNIALAFAGAAMVSGCNPPAPATPPSPVSGAAVPRVIPSPALLTLAGGAPFELTRATRITLVGSNPEVDAIGQSLAALLRKSTDFPYP